MADTVISVRNLTKTYHLGDVEVNALRHVDLDIRSGEFVAIMGSSGSGKSTLMNTLGCLDRPTSGAYRLEGTDVGALDESDLASIRSNRIGFVFQSFNLLARTSALENVQLPLFYAGEPGDGPERALGVLHLLGLQGREHNQPSQLSGGQQQRVAIARALINNPAILLADEPTGNLDSKTANEIMGILRALNEQRGLTIVLVTHEADMAAFADRVITMRDGVIISDERNDPASRPQIGVPVMPALPVQVRAKDTGQPSARSGLWPFTRMAFSAAARAIGRNKLRSALTMLGIFIGVAALIVMVAVGQGANLAVKQRIEGLGTNLLIIVPGAANSGGARGGFGSASTLTTADAAAIREGASEVANVGYLNRSSAQVQYGNKNWTTSIQGVTPSFLEIRNWPVSAGRAFTAQDQEEATRNCLLGATVARTLFGENEDPVGATIIVKNVPMKVIGVLEARGQTGFGQDQDDTIMIPFSTAERKVLGVASPGSSASTSSTSTSTSGSSSSTGSSSGSTSSTTSTATNVLLNSQTNPFGISPRLTGYANMVFVQARDSESVAGAKKQVEEILRKRHRITDPANDDFDVRNISDVAQAQEAASQVFAMLLASVASISLLVGGIGIMNILLVSVTERTREIGIRMAIGARRVHVLTQFLLEAVLLSAMGGAIGIVFGVGVSVLVSKIAGWPTLLSPTAIVGAFIFSAIVGIFFGYYPARRASLLNPIEALRYE